MKTKVVYSEELSSRSLKAKDYIKPETSTLKQARPYRVWHIANVPNRPFHVYVETIKKAKQVLQFLFDYDNYLGDGVVDTNASGLEVFEDGDWYEYHDENDDDIMAIMRKESDGKPLVLTPEH